MMTISILVGFYFRLHNSCSAIDEVLYASECMYITLRLQQTQAHHFEVGGHNVSASLRALFYLYSVVVDVGKIVNTLAQVLRWWFRTRDIQHLYERLTMRHEL